MSVMKVMSAREGHKTLEWDKVEDKDNERVDVARAEFERLVTNAVRTPFVAYKVDTTKGTRRQGEPITEFDETADEILLVPPLAGGA